MQCLQCMRTVFEHILMAQLIRKMAEVFLCMSYISDALLVNVSKSLLCLLLLQVCVWESTIRKATPIAAAGYQSKCSCEVTQDDPILFPCNSSTDSCKVCIKSNSIKVCNVKLLHFGVVVTYMLHTHKHAY